MYHLVVMSVFKKQLLVLWSREPKGQWQKHSSQVIPVALHLWSGLCLSSVWESPWGVKNKSSSESTPISAMSTTWRCNSIDYVCIESLREHAETEIYTYIHNRTFMSNLRLTGAPLHGMNLSQLVCCRTTQNSMELSLKRILVCRQAPNARAESGTAGQTMPTINGTVFNSLVIFWLIKLTLISCQWSMKSFWILKHKWSSEDNSWCFEV